VNATHAAARQDLLDELGMTCDEFTQRLAAERAALRTPIDFADLERRGVLAATKGGWFFVLQWGSLPLHARMRVSTLRSGKVGTRVVPMVKFYR